MKQKQNCQKKANVTGRHSLRKIVKVTVQFETEGNGQNEIVSHMERSEVKL